MKHPLESLLTAGGILLMALLSCLLLPAPSLGLVLAQFIKPVSSIPRAEADQTA